MEVHNLRDVVLALFVRGTVVDPLVDKMPKHHRDLVLVPPAGHIVGPEAVVVGADKGGVLDGLGLLLFIDKVDGNQFNAVVSKDLKSGNIENSKEVFFRQGGISKSVAASFSQPLA